MRRTVRFALLAGCALWVLSAAIAPVRAEKPLSSPAVLEKTATHIVRGTVARVFTRVRREGPYEKTGYVAEVHLSAVEKGEGVPLDRPLYARYWTKAFKGPGMPPPGTGGHGPLAAEGQTVRLYLARNAYDGFGTEIHDGGYDVIGKNGIQVLTAEEARAADAEASPAVAPTFPQAWEGRWEGELVISAPGRDDARSKMVLVIQATKNPNRWAFRIRYGDQPLRRYQLIVEDAAKGRYAIDEGNGIVLPATVLDGELFSTFSLGGNLIAARYRLDGDFLRFDLTQTGMTPQVTTGGGDVPEVVGHPVQVVQHARLQR